MAAAFPAAGSPAAVATMSLTSGAVAVNGEIRRRAVGATRPLARRCGHRRVRGWDV
jgi:hypothetical protein